MTETLTMTDTLTPPLDLHSDLRQDLHHATDDALMAIINGGRAEEGLAILQDRHASRVFDCANSVLRDPQLSQEVTNDTFAKVFFKSHLYRPEGRFLPWLLEVTRNHALSTLRSQRHAPYPLGSLASPGDDGEGDFLQQVGDDRHHRHAEEREFAAAFDAAFAALPDRYREVFELCVHQGMFYKEAARKLGLPTGTVAIRIMRARKQLFRQLSRHLDRVRRMPACFE